MINPLLHPVLKILEDDLAFRAWLSSKDPGIIVGVQSDPCRCPVANFIKSTLDLEYIAVLGFRVVIHSGNLDTIIEVPDWVGYFTINVDNTSDFQVTAQNALTVLDRIPSSS